MNRRLLILDIALGAGVIYGGIQLHNEWLAAKARQAAMPGPAPKPLAMAHMPALPQQPAILPSGYKQIAINTLFDPSRNPNIPVDPPPPPPPPKQPPPLPQYHGMMDFGDPQGPIALITPEKDARHEEVHAGEMIGEFKLLSFNREEMVLEWDGKQIHTRLGEAGPDPAARPKASAVEPITNYGIIPGQAPKETLPQPQQQQQQLGPGQAVTDTVKACQPNDGTPAGTVTDGYRKEVHISPLGTSQCIWRALDK